MGEEEYVYCGNDPVNFADLDGVEPIDLRRRNTVIQLLGGEKPFMTPEEANDLIDLLMSLQEIGYSGAIGPACGTFNTISIAPNLRTGISSLNIWSKIKLWRQSRNAYRAFKLKYGKAIAGHEWHHIVEQRLVNVGRFGTDLIFSNSNSIQIPKGVHTEISAFYSSIQPISYPLTVRKWLENQSFLDQFVFGLQTLRRYGVSL